MHIKPNVKCASNRSACSPQMFKPVHVHLMACWFDSLLIWSPQVFFVKRSGIAKFSDQKMTWLNNQSRFGSSSLASFFFWLVFVPLISDEYSFLCHWKYGISWFPSCWAFEKCVMHFKKTGGITCVSSTWTSTYHGADTIRLFRTVPMTNHDRQLIMLTSIIVTPQYPWF